ncbi:hypothetical protein MYMAC_003811 [Corallococcus macrosporus DSM 14697]|uniref:Uncharacterized protein n=1 Tax=Corallococcus macrosporus DSM 14697 TaxID=1189310 RepID=A0A250JWH7_9BACT|nr:hypothetical protein MYMAC_003811 [Corallococcus macrosporus DSM 14697]
MGLFLGDGQSIVAQNMGARPPPSLYGEAHSHPEHGAPMPVDAGEGARALRLELPPPRVFHGAPGFFAPLRPRDLAGSDRARWQCPSPGRAARSASKACRPLPSGHLPAPKSRAGAGQTVSGSEFGDIGMRTSAWPPRPSAASARALIARLTCAERRSRRSGRPLRGVASTEPSRRGAEPVPALAVRECRGFGAAKCPDISQQRAPQVRPGPPGVSPHGARDSLTSTRARHVWAASAAQTTR